MEEAKTWSEGLRKTTKELLEESTFPPMPGGVPMRHFDHAFGLIKIEDALNHNWVIKDRSTGKVSKYDSVDDLINDGWAID